MAYAAECRASALANLLEEKRRQAFCGYDVSSEIVDLQRDYLRALEDVAYYRRQELAELQEKEREQRSYSESSTSTSYGGSDDSLVCLLI